MSRMPNSIQLLSPQDIVVNWLNGLDASGAIGFEGILRDAMSELTGQGFELSKSGPQGGVDMAHLGNRVAIGIEAKRYRASTFLALDALRSKVGDAVETYPDMDTWVLATTREIALGDAEELRRFGEERGINVLVLDASTGPLGINRLVALLAACPDTIRIWSQGRADLIGAFEAVRGNPAWTRTVDEFREKLTLADVGWQALGQTLAVWMRNAMRARANARHHLGTFGEIHAPGIQLVDRPDITSCLDTLLTQCGIPHAVVGDEGHGKTWSVLSWWSDRAGPAGINLPPIVFLPAQHIHGSDPELLIAEALWRRTGLRNVDFWMRRLARWKRDGRARLLVVLDGLNQARSAVVWSELVRPFIVDQWAGRVSVILTARQSDWLRIGQLRDLEPAIRIIPAGPFSDEQLDTLLTRLEKSRDDFDPRLIPLMRVPRLFAIAVARGSGEMAMTELTPEALALEEYRHRLSRHGDALPLDETSFRDLVSRLGSRFRQAQRAGQAIELTLKEVREEIGRESGLEHGLDAMLSELASGRWLEQVGQYRFRLDPCAVPMALGLALVDHLLEGEESLAASLPDFLDPFRGSDLGVSILRSASAVAMLQDEVPDLIRTALLREWVDSPNFASRDFQTFWRLACTRPGPVLDVAEAAWLERHGGHGFDEVLTKALSNAATQVASAGTTVRERLEVWLSTWWPDYLEGLILGRALEIEGRDDRCSQVLTRVEEWAREVAPRLSYPPALCRVESGEGWAWVVRRALVTASYMPRAGLAGAFGGWAAVCAVLGTEPFRDLACWTLRINAMDPDNSSVALLAVAQEYAAVGHPLADRAAALLFDVLASPVAEPPQASADQPPSDRNFQIDPTRLRDAQRHYPEGEEPGEPARTSVARYWATAVQRGEWIAATEQETLWTLAGLARWASGSLDTLLAKVRDRAPELDLVALSQIAMQAMYLPIAFGQPERDVLLAAYGARDEANRSDQDDGRHQFTFIALRLLGATGEEQANILAANRDFMPHEDLTALLVALPADRWQVDLRAARDAADTEEVLRWLRLGAAAGLETLPFDRDLIVGLTCHTDPCVRAAAMELLLRLRDEDMSTDFARHGWTWRPGTPRPEAAFGSLILLHAKATMGRDVLDRADQQVAGEAFKEDAGELPRLARFVAERVALLTDNSRSWTTEFEWARMDSAIESLVAAMPDEADRWTEALYQGRAYHASVSMLSPLTGLLRGLLRHRPGKAAHHWRELVRLTRASATRSVTVELLPFDVPLVGEVADLRYEALDLIHDDEDLATAADKMSRAPDDGWLSQMVRRDLASSAAGTVARAMTLAGFARVSGATKGLWERELSGYPARGWLASVHHMARAAFRAHEQSLDLAYIFATTLDPQQARDAYLRLRACWDIRTIAMFEERVRAGEWPLEKSRERQWRLDRRQRQVRVDELNVERRNTFCGTRTVRDMSPWR
jgi:hypothetical protein